VLEDIIVSPSSSSASVNEKLFFSTKISKKKGEAITQVQGFIALLKFVKKNVKLKIEDSK
jgi:N-methylhydantoinase B/oxoprolinase/acetone carboxylase alpha subunit